MLILHRNDVPVPPIVDDITTILADMPNQTASDHRKRATLAAACVSIAELIQAGALADAGEAVAVFRIETANLRNDDDWRSIQGRFESLLYKAENLEEQESIIRAAAVRLQD